MRRGVQIGVGQRRRERVEREEEGLRERERECTCGGLVPRLREWGSERMGMGDAAAGVRAGGARAKRWA
jgi:hypothetical protein